MEEYNFVWQLKVMSFDVGSMVVYVPLNMVDGLLGRLLPVIVVLIRPLRLTWCEKKLVLAGRCGGVLERLTFGSGDFGLGLDWCETVEYWMLSKISVCLKL